MDEKLTWWRVFTLVLSSALIVAGMTMYLVSCILATSGACDAAMFSAEWSIYLTIGGLVFAGSDAAAGIVLMFPIVVIVLGVPFVGAGWIGGCA